MQVVHAEDHNMHRQLRRGLRDPVAVTVHPLKGQFRQAFDSFILFETVLMLIRY